MNIETRRALKRIAYTAQLGLNECPYEQGYEQFKKDFDLIKRELNKQQRGGE